MVENAPDAARSLASSMAAHPTARPARNLAWALRAGGCPAEAVLVLRTLVARDPTSARTLASLGNALRQLSRQMNQADTFSAAGAARRESLLRDARHHLSRAADLAPDDQRLRLSLGELLFEEGRSAEGLALIRAEHESHPTAASAAALGVALHRSEVADFDAALPAYQQAISLNRGDRKTMTRLASVALRTGSWAGWDALMDKQYVRRPDAPDARLLRRFERALRNGASTEETAELTAELRELVRRGVGIHPGLLQTVSTRLQGMGQFSSGFAVRRILAEQTARTPANHLPHVGSFRRWAAATVTLGRAQDVADRFHPYPWKAMPAESRFELDAILADVRLSMGDPGILQRQGTDTSDSNPSPGDELMRRLVRGRRVAIVGPGLPSGSYGEQIDDFDTVIRPRYSREFVETNRATSGSRTDIAYYAGTDVSAVRDTGWPAVQSGELRLVVARPLSYAALADLAAESSWLRFYRRDYSLIMNGTPLGMTRILHDVLRFEPAHIALYNVDYYTGPTTFATGYRSGRDAQAVAGSIVMDIFRAHDLLADFEIHHRLFQAGVLTGPPEVTRIAGLTPDQYTGALTAAWGSSERSSPQS